MVSPVGKSEFKWLLGAAHGCTVAIKAQPIFPLCLFNKAETSRFRGRDASLIVLKTEPRQEQWMLLHGTGGNTALVHPLPL